MSAESELIRRNLQRIRSERGLSMGELARRSGLAKQTLSVIETGNGNPTVETLGALASALGVSTRRLLTEWGSPLFVQRAEEAEWNEDGSRATRELGQVYGSGYVRSSILRLHRGKGPEPVRQPLDPGALHHVYAVEGRVRCGTENEAVDLSEGDFARFPADVAHIFEALSSACLVHVVTTMPQQAQFGLAH